MARIEVDIPCDPTQIDHTGMPWAFLDEAEHRERIVEKAIVLIGDADDPVFARVVSLTERPTGVKVHLEILPGDPLDYVKAARRCRLLPRVVLSRGFSCTRLICSSMCAGWP